MQTFPISVVIPCYRCNKTIDRAIKSIWDQNYRPNEVILVEDCSDDLDKTINSLYVCKSKYPDGWITIKKMERNSGPGIARNKGWSLAKNPYIAFLDADDSWHPRKIEIQYTFMKENPNILMSGHNFKFKSAAIKKLNCSLDQIRSYKVNFWGVLIRNPFPTPSVMLKKELSYRFGEKKYSEDYLLWLRIVLNKHPVWKIDEDLVFLHKKPFGESGLSNSLLKMQKGELDTYKVIYNEKLINRIVYIIISAISTIKFLFRLIKSRFKI